MTPPGHHREHEREVNATHVRKTNVSEKLTRKPREGWSVRETHT